MYKADDRIHNLSNLLKSALKKELNPKLNYWLPVPLPTQKNSTMVTK